MFANQVSIAIENAMFFEELDAAKQRAEAYREKLQETNTRLSRSNQDLQHLAVHQRNLSHCLVVVQEAEVS